MERREEMSVLCQGRGVWGRTGRFAHKYEATAGIEPAHSGFADRRVNQLRHVAMNDYNLMYKLSGHYPKRSGGAAPAP